MGPAVVTRGEGQSGQMLCPLTHALK
jgi:hypothetical protein